MSRYENLKTICFAGVLSIGLAACGGGDDMTVPEQTPQMACEDADGRWNSDNTCTSAGELLVEGAESATDAAMAAVAALDEMSTDAEVNAAKALIASARAAQSAAASELTGGDAVTLDGRIRTIEMTLATTETAISAHREQNRMADVATARMNAMQSYMAADADATKAEAQADAAEQTASGTPGAMAAREAADAARTAATAAKAAHDGIMDEMTKAEADAQAAEAAAQAGHANAGYMTAKAENEDIQTTHGQIAENNRKAAVYDARMYGGEARDNALASATAARAAAGAAKTAYENAKAEHQRAMSARTNAEKAEAAMMAAQMAYMAADAAANDAHDAYMAAMAAVAGVMDDTSLMDANAARAAAEMQEGVAAGHLTTAMMGQTDAEGAESDAMMYADDHVVGLLEMANAEHIITAADPDANLDETELELIRKNVNAHIAMVNTAVKAANDDSTDPSHGGGTVTATWHYYGDLGTSGEVGGTGAEADTKPGEGLPAISVDPGGDGGDPVALRHAGPGELADDPDDDLTDNFGQGPGLGVFTHEKYISGLDTTTTEDLNDYNNQRVIVFTDLEQAEASVPAVTAAVQNAEVTASQVIEADPPNGVTGAEFDHDNNPDTDPLEGAFACASGANCSIEIGNDGEVTDISGYTFTSSGFPTAQVIVAAEPSTLDTTWLAFGVWLTETVVVDGTNTYAFGAFAGGGDAVEAADNIAQVTGDATYNGKAAGVHSTATAVDFFHADATLDAKFGTGAADAFGTITGTIHNIMAAGRLVDDIIELVVIDPGNQDPAQNITTDGGFAGRARMQNTGEQDSSGEDIYRYTGTWDGNFYNHIGTDNAATTDVMENERAPGSVAGTFGVGRADVTATMDVDETESYVGAFGAHCTGGATICNPN